MGVAGRVARSIAAVSLLGVLVVVSASPAAAQASCFGRPVTIFAVAGQLTSGTPGADVILGTPGPDEIRAGAGDDRVCSGGGADEVWGGGGDDLISLGSGDDVGRGGSGHDLIRGKQGRDVLRGGKGRDTLAGGAGTDHIWGDGGADSLTGNRGADVLRGGKGRDTVTGNGGRDVLFGGSKDDVIDGGGKGDTLYGSSGDDLLRGGSGIDDCNGGRGVDTIVSCEIEAIPPGAACNVSLDLTTWREALYDNEWSVTAARADHDTTGHPSMLVSPDGTGCRSATFSGTLRVEAADRDWVGFVLGASSPTAHCERECAVEGVFVTWKSNSETFCGLSEPDAPAGWSARRVEGIVDIGRWVSTCDDVFSVFADVETTDPRSTMLGFVPGPGWVRDTTYEYAVAYSNTNLRLVIDDVEVFDIAGSFPLGSLGFFNLSQSGAQYTIDSFVGS